MATWVPPRLRPIIGTDLDSASAATVELLRDLAEDTDLEFKRQPWGRSERDVKECALDIADKVNAGGGLVVVGIDEDKDGVPHDLTPVSPDEGDLPLRVHQIVAARVSPPPQVKHVAVEVDDGLVHIFSVQPSPLKPHSVHVGGESLRVPVRAGKTRRNLSEPEIADLYQARFRGAAEEAQRLKAARDNSLTLVPDKGRESIKWVWLAISAVQSSPGNLSLRPNISTDWRGWIDEDLRTGASQRRSSDLHTATGFRSIGFADAFLYGRLDVYALSGVLTLDGGGYMVLGCPKSEVSPFPPSEPLIFDDFLFGDVIAGVSILASHAVRCGAGGLITFSAQLVNRGHVALGEALGQRNSVLGGSHSIEGSTEASVHSAQLDDVAVAGPAQVALAKSLQLDLVSAFGLEDVRQVTSEGEIVLNAFLRSETGAIRGWAEAAGVPVVG